MTKKHSDATIAALAMSMGDQKAYHGGRAVASLPPGSKARARAAKQHQRTNYAAREHERLTKLQSEAVADDLIQQQLGESESILGPRVNKAAARRGGQTDLQMRKDAIDALAQHGFRWARGSAADDAGYNQARRSKDWKGGTFHAEHPKGGRLAVRVDSRGMWSSEVTHQGDHSPSIAASGHPSALHGHIAKWKSGHFGQLTPGARFDDDLHAKGRADAAFRKLHMGENIVNESSLRLLKTHGAGAKTAKVYRDSDSNEFRVRHYTSGLHHEPSYYFTNDLEDAHATAQYWTNDSKRATPPATDGSGRIGNRSAQKQHKFEAWPPNVRSGTLQGVCRECGENASHPRHQS